MSKDTQRQKEERAEKGVPESSSDTNTRTAVDSLRTFVQDDLPALQKGVQELNRKVLLANGSLSKSIDEALKTVRPSDLTQTSGHKTILLSLADSYLGHLTKLLRRATKDQLSKDLVLVRDGLRASEEQFAKQVERFFGAAFRVEFYAPDERALRETVAEALEVQIRYKGEMPRRGFLQRLSEGRRLIFAALMTLSLFIGLLTGRANARSLLAPFGALFIILFMIGVAWTYRTWKKEDAERLVKEIDKVKEQLRTEVLRLCGEAQREKIARIGEHLEQVRRDVLRRLDDFVRQVSQQRTAEAAKERQVARERLRAIDQRIKDLEALRTPLQKLDQDCNDLRRECETALRTVLKA